MGIVVLPKTLTAHTDAVASDVMADLNAILAVLNGNVDSDNLAAAIEEALFLPGDLRLTARSSAPSGWLLCDGAAVSRSTYADLFAAIGTTYGAGDGRSTFNLPDYRGRTPVGVDGSAGRLSANDALGNAGGAEKHTLVTGEMPAHSHSMGAAGAHAHSLNWNSIYRTDGFSGGVSSGSGIGTTGSVGDHTHSLANTGGGGSHNNMQPYQVCNVLVKI